MPTRRFDLTKEQSIGQWSGGGTGNNRGSGKDTHAPIGRHQSSDIVWRLLERYAMDFTGMAQITGAVLKRKTTGQIHLAFGGTPRIYTRRLNGAFSQGGGGENNWTTGSAEDWPGPGATTTGQSDSGLLTDNEQTWIEQDVTALIGAHAPPTVLRADGTPGGGAANYGFEVRSFDETTSARTIEFFGYRSTVPAYIIVTYTENRAPDKPVGTAPAGSVLTTPTFSGTGSDPDAGDTFDHYSLQVTTDPSFATISHWDGTLLTAGISGWNLVDAPYAGPALPLNTTLYWRFRTFDAAGAASPWSDPITFTIQAAPTTSAWYPQANFAQVWNLGDLVVWTSGGSHAKPRVRFTYNSAAGLAMSHLRVWLLDDALVQLYDSGEVARVASPGAVVEFDVDYAIPNLTQYRWKVQVRDSGGNWSTVSGPFPLKVCWGQALYTHNPGAASASWQITTGALTGSSAQLATIFQSAGDSAGTVTPSAWMTAIGMVPVQDWVRVLVRLACGATTSNPRLADLVFRNTAASTTPDNWQVLAGTLVQDPDVRRFGYYSGRLAANGTGVAYIYAFRKGAGDGIPVVPGAKYTISLWVRTEANLAPNYITARIFNTAHGAILATPVSPPGYSMQTSDTRSQPDGWQRLVGTFTVPTGVTVISILFQILPASPTPAGTRIWFDGMLLEEGEVASAWSPGLLGDGTTLDNFGVNIDRSKGGTLRLRGTSGGVRDTVELGSRGLLFGGDTDLFSDQINVLRVNGAFFPTTDNTRNLGAAAARWNTVYAGTGTINTSDEREKSIRGGLSNKELRAAKACASLITVFQMNEAIARKGKARARLHVGVVAQQIAEVFISEGLDPADYGLYTHDQWEEFYEVNPRTEVDPQTGFETQVIESVIVPGGDRYGVRYDELLTFIMAAQEHRLQALEREHALDG